MQTLINSVSKSSYIIHKELNFKDLNTYLYKDPQRHGYTHDIRSQNADTYVISDEFSHIMGLNFLK